MTISIGEEVNIIEAGKIIGRVAAVGSNSIVLQGNIIGEESQKVRGGMEKERKARLIGIGDEVFKEDNV